VGAAEVGNDVGVSVGAALGLDVGATVVGAALGLAVGASEHDPQRYGQCMENVPLTPQSAERLAVCACGWVGGWGGGGGVSKSHFTR
jgi:hypothetical protein